MNLDHVTTWDLLARSGFPRSTSGCKQFQRAWHFTRDGALVVDGDPGTKTRKALIFSLRRRALGLGDLSANFSFAEFACKCGGRYSACRRVLATWELLHALEVYRAEVGGPVTIISGYRCPQHNATIPGAATASQHVTGLGVDVRGQLTVGQVRKLGLFSGIGYGSRSGKVTHLDVRPGSRSAPATWAYAGW